MTDALTRSRGTYLDIKNRAEQVEVLYTDAKVPLPRNSGLGVLVQNAKDLWDRWLANDRASLTPDLLFRGLHLMRIAEALLPLRDQEHSTGYLKRLLLDSLDFFERKTSRAKNTLWELEVWTKLRKRTEDAALRDPPDVVVTCGGTRIGIACKKIYSERHVQNVLSEGVGQVARDCEFGVVAMNIDDLTPGGVVLCETNSARVTDRLYQANGEFLRRHDRHFRKYLSQGRLIAAIISTSVISDIRNERPRFNNSGQWLVWNVSGLPKHQKKALSELYRIVVGP